MPQTERIDIGDLLVELCERFGLKKENCLAIHILPDHIRFDTFLTKEGNKYIRERISADIST